MTTSADPATRWANRLGPLEHALGQLHDHMRQALVLFEGSRVVYANDHFARLSGHDVNDLTAPGFDARALWGPGEARLEARLDAAGTAQALPSRASLHLLRKDGSQLLVDAVSVGLLVEGRPMRLALVRDVTRERLIDARLDDARRELGRHEKRSAMAALVRGLAHEVRTPLTAMQNDLALLRTRLARLSAEPPRTAGGVAETDVLLDQLQEGISRLGGSVAELRRHTRAHVDTGQRWRLDEVAREALDLLPLTRPSRVAIETDLAAVPAVPMDRGRMAHVALCLLENAVEATMEHSGAGTVRLATCTTRTGVRLIVTDHAGGIPASVMGLLYEPLVTTKPGAAGLGLAVAKAAVEDHGGMLAYETGPHGTAFLVDLPFGQ